MNGLRKLAMLGAVLLAALLLLPAPAEASARNRGRYFRALQDSLIRQQDSLARQFDSLAVADSLLLNDSLALKDTLPVLDSATLAARAEAARLQHVHDSLDLIYWGELDTVTLPRLDTLITEYFDSLIYIVGLPDSADIRRAKRRIQREIRDSLREAKPRVLETFAVPESLYYRRILVWTSDKQFNEYHEAHLDTTANSNFFDLAMYKKDVGATYLGTPGSATQYYNWFKREETPDAPMFTPYIGDSYTDETMPMFNTKTPYTELGYSGTLLAAKAKEESNLRLLSTQNITPEFNFTLFYRRVGSRGMLQNEQTDHRTTVITGNYLGKRYFANFGTIRQRVIRQENGGIRDVFWIRDTTIDAKAIDVNLSKAENTYKRRMYFIHQTFAVPINFFRKDKDSLKLGEGTMAHIGHSAEFTTYNKLYTDEIALTDTYGRDFYFNKFYMNDTKSSDELAVRNFENRLYIKLQPYAPDALLSKVNAGVGYQILSTYGYKPGAYLTGKKYDTQHNVHIYGGASGQLRKYIAWNADVDYYLAGYRMFDFDVNANLRFSFYPLDQGIHISGKFHTGLRKPHPFEQQMYTNHHQWNNDFSKVSRTTVEAKLSIPKWHLEAGFNYGLVGNMLYYDSLSVIRQHTESPISVMTAYLQKDFHVWHVHFENRALFQLSSNQEVLPLPKLALNLRWYFDINVVKDVMNLQIGVNAYASTRWYAPSYSPDTGQFFNQTRDKIGNYPYFDAFLNAQWKVVSLFIKYTNTFQGWPTADYFSAYHYIQPLRGIKLGILWPFYMW